MIAEHMAEETYKHMKGVAEVVNYLNNNIAASWTNLTKSNIVIQNFAGERIAVVDSIPSQIKNKILNMGDFIDQNIDTLAHCSWPYKEEEPTTCTVLNKEQGMDSDHL